MFKIIVSSVVVDQEEPLTYGQKQVGTNFNPSQDQDVAELKALQAAFIDKAEALRGKAVSPEVKRHLSVAITEAKTASMWAVGGATWRD